MNISLLFKTASGLYTYQNELLSFSFRKDAYLPYTVLNAKLRCSSDIPKNSCEVSLYIGNKLLHHGTIDTLTETLSGGTSIASFSSRGFTSMLDQNQIEPGLKFNISFNQLMDSFYPLPYITHENNSDSSGYIYVDKNSTMWDSIVNLAYRQCGRYPYIRDDNCVRITPVPQPAVFSYNNSQLLSVGSEISGKRLISHFHMANMSGEYGEYELEDTDVVNAKIVRHHYLDLDMEFLRDPQDALLFRDKYAFRARKRFFCSYSGYNGEDISDIVTFQNIISQRIAAVSVRGSQRGVITEISVYEDKFPRDP